MKQFDVNAVGLRIRFVSRENEEIEELEVTEMPFPNFLSDSIRDSENSIEEEFESDSDGHSYRVVVYKSAAEGNVEVFDLTSDEEVADFEVEEYYD